MSLNSYKQHKLNKQKIWLDNYGAGFHATPLEVHTYWNEIIKLEEKSKKHHSELSQNKHKDLYNNLSDTAGNTKLNKKYTKFSADFGSLLVLPTN